MVAFRREKFAPRGGPSGGDGGRGGNVVVLSSPDVNTLQGFRHRQFFQARDGEDGRRNRQQGRSGEDLVVRVPVGTEVWDVSSRGRRRNRAEGLLGDLVAPGQRLVVAKGGRGGRGNVWFASPSNQEPLLAEAGQTGESRDLRLELKLLADVGIVGMPNAGKSSLLVALSGSRAKVADYPFTTLEPQLGVMTHRLDALVLVEIPGLVEGAAEGRGLGHEFLRHVERTRFLLHVVDGAEPDVAERISVINSELVQFDETLGRRPQVVAINKTDRPEVAGRLDVIRREAGSAVSPGTPVMAVSAATHDGLDALRDALFHGLAEVREAEARLKTVAPEAVDLPVLKPGPRRTGADVVRVAGGYRVLHPRAVRVALGSDLDKFEVQVQFHHLLERLGVATRLVEAGVKAGDTVWVGEHELEWS